MEDNGIIIIETFLNMRMVATKLKMGRLMLDVDVKQGDGWLTKGCTYMSKAHARQLGQWLIKASEE